LPFNTGASCTLQGDATSVRGSQNAAHPPVPPAAAPGSGTPLTVSAGQPDSPTLEEMLWLGK
jgi:phospholipid/cholesterol/gamma-HCH transport system substrate-binding protein